MPIHCVKLVRNSVIDRPSNPFNFDTTVHRRNAAGYREFSLEASCRRTVTLIKKQASAFGPLAGCKCDRDGLHCYLVLASRVSERSFHPRAAGSRNYDADSFPSGSYRRFSALNSLRRIPLPPRAPFSLEPFHSARNSPRWIGYLRYYRPYGVFLARDLGVSVFTRYPDRRDESFATARILPATGYAETGRTAGERTD